MFIYGVNDVFYVLVFINYGVSVCFSINCGFCFMKEYIVIGDVLEVNNKYDGCDG